ncbi:type II toxin-antitoxin system VapC family toxin [Trichlorobacter ammonificans]|uniref:PilT protein domain protein n=1 Tax=Trichlorobacter ammonificans TaxID=2916410 RepID=A0ABN8HI49_9BACT|nr:PIN domain-containing protein [Trichlorobacter ammonificans]CAH2030833.1 PilT protein domain protein [Trichlorobacter ammonificans]
MTIVLDACIIMYWVEGVEPYYSRVASYIKQLEGEQPRVSYAVSRISLLECLVKPVRDNEMELLQRYGEFFASRNLRIIELSPGVIDRAIQVRAFCNLKTADAMQAASALSLKGPVCFVTNDKRFGVVPGLSIRMLPE